MVANLTLDDILLSYKSPKIALAPYPHLVLSDFFPWPIYEALLKEFPDREAFRRRLFSEKKFYTTTDETSEVLADKPTWQLLIRLLTSQEFATDYHNVMSLGIRSVRKFFGRGDWIVDPLRTKSNAHITSNLVTPHYQFSRLEAGSYVVPHTDKLEKLAGMVFYFPPPDWRHEWGGGTSVLQAKDKAQNKNWSNWHLDFDELEVVEEQDFKPNTCFTFLKAENSWHAVSPIKCPEGVGRNTFNFFYFLNSLSGDSFASRAIHSFHRRQELRSFPEGLGIKEQERRMIREAIEEQVQQGKSAERIAVELRLSVNQVRKFWPKQGG